VTSEDVADKRRVVGFEGRSQCFERVFGGNINVQLERGPGVKAAFAGDDVQSVGKFGLRGHDAEGHKTCSRGCIRCEALLQQDAGLFLEIFEVGTRGKFA
jgi:hypothetical protein